MDKNDTTACCQHIILNRLQDAVHVSDRVLRLCFDCLIVFSLQGSGEKCCGHGLSVHAGPVQQASPLPTLPLTPTITPQLPPDTHTDPQPVHQSRLSFCHPQGNGTSSYSDSGPQPAPDPVNLQDSSTDILKRDHRQERSGRGDGRGISDENVPYNQRGAANPSKLEDTRVFDEGSGDWKPGNQAEGIGKVTCLHLLTRWLVSADFLKGGLQRAVADNSYCMACMLPSGTGWS